MDASHYFTQFIGSTPLVLIAGILFFAGMVGVISYLWLSERKAVQRSSIRTIHNQARQISAATKEQMDQLSADTLNQLQEEIRRNR